MTTESADATPAATDADQADETKAEGRLPQKISRREIARGASARKDLRTNEIKGTDWRGDEGLVEGCAGSCEPRSHPITPGHRGAASKLPATAARPPSAQLS